MIGSLLAALAALSFIGLGASAALGPSALSKNYGLPAGDATTLAYVRAVGARDAVLGVLLLWFLWRDEREALAATTVASALAGASDFALVWTARGPAAWRNLALHGTGTAGLLLIWRLLQSDR